MCKQLLILIFVIPFQIPIYGQRDSIISGVQFEGLKKTKETYLENILGLKDPSQFRADQLSGYVQRLKNLTNIADAQARIDTVGGQNVLHFDVEEANTLFPILNFGGIRDNLWFQVGFSEINWQGKGHQLSMFYRNNDARNNYNLFYKVPYINGSRFGGSLSFLRWASTEPLYFNEGAVFYDYTNLSFGLSGIYEFTAGHNIELGATYFIEDYEKGEDQELSNPPGPQALRQPKWLGKITHKIDRVNYDFHRQEGLFNLVTAQAVYNTLDGTWFFIVLNNLHWFKTLNETESLALRLRLGLSTNENTPFAPFVLDSNVNIRGSGNRIDRGTGVAVLNLEYRYELWNRKENDVAIQGVLFSDLGSWRNPGGDLDDLFDQENFRHFVGGGIRFVYKKAYNAILRLDYGLDIYDLNQRGFVIGIGQYF